MNKRYTPFYKWMHRAVIELPLLGKAIHTLISDLITQPAYDEKQKIIERICALIISALRDAGLSDSASDFLLDHARRLHDRIEDRRLAAQFSVAD